MLRPKTLLATLALISVGTLTGLPAASASSLSASKATATLKNGVLALSIPKTAQAKKPAATKVEVKAA